MDIQHIKYLPGGFDQYIQLNKTVELNNKKILSIGSGLELLFEHKSLSIFIHLFFC